ncbi:MAG TPA: PIG-L deacetylase family protein [Solirubrobacteraceae bacterium]|nr:PIG-L deacetylase family protein [Solirubrobacteraceae bacterium]
MRTLPFPPPAAGAPLRVLALGCHSDDIEIGCGGTLLALKESGRALDVRWVVFSTLGERREEARASAEELLDGVERREVVLHDFRDGFLPYAGGAVKEAVEAMKDFAPDVIFTHQRHDLHQDHRLLCELTWNTFRDHLILEYEIPKYDGDMGVPNVFVPLAESTCRRKVALLMRHFGSQRSKRWFTEDVFYGLLRLRGMESGSSRYAEAFYGRKVVLAAGEPAAAHSTHG